MLPHSKHAELFLEALDKNINVLQKELKIPERGAA